MQGRPRQNHEQQQNDRQDHIDIAQQFDTAVKSSVHGKQCHPGDHGNDDQLQTQGVVKSEQKMQPGCCLLSPEPREVARPKIVAMTAIMSTI